MKMVSIGLAVACRILKNKEVEEVLPLVFVMTTVFDALIIAAIIDVASH